MMGEEIDSWIIIKVTNIKPVQLNWTNIEVIQKALEEYNDKLSKSNSLLKKYLGFKLEDIEHSWDDEGKLKVSKKTPINDFIERQNESKTNT